MVNFDVTKEDGAIINKIVDRAINEHPAAGFDRMTLTMDITCVHANEPLDLERFLAADGLHFVHDACGISRHLNRETGEIENFFRPRFTKRVAA